MRTNPIKWRGRFLGPSALDIGQRNGVVSQETMRMMKSDGFAVICLVSWREPDRYDIWSVPPVIGTHIANALKKELNELWTPI